MAPSYMVFQTVSSGGWHLVGAQGAAHLVPPVPLPAVAEPLLSAGEGRSTLIASLHHSLLDWRLDWTLCMGGRLTGLANQRSALLYITSDPRVDPTQNWVDPRVEVTQSATRLPRTGSRCGSSQPNDHSLYI